jgi:hypothetical protein
MGRGIALAASSGFAEVDVQLARVVLVLHAAAVARLVAQSDFSDEPQGVEVVGLDLAPDYRSHTCSNMSPLSAIATNSDPGCGSNTFFRCRFNTEIGNQAWSWKRALISAYAKVPLR